MPHGNVDSEKATAQNAATPPEAPNDQARDEHASIRPEPSSYAAADVRDSTVAGPAAGELGDYADLDEPSGGMAQGQTNTNREAHAHQRSQGPETLEANRKLAGSGSPDQGRTEVANAPRGTSTGANSRPLDDTVAETGPGIADDAVMPGELAPGDLDLAEADRTVERLQAEGWADPPHADPPAGDAEAETEAHPT